MPADVADWPEIAAELGRRLRTLREQAGLSQERLAHEAGLSRNHLQLIETGSGNPRARTLYGLAEALRVPVSELLPERSDAAPAASTSGE